MQTSSRNLEMKYIVVNLRSVLTSISTATAAYGLSALIDQGADFNQRIGRSVTLVGAHVSAFLQGAQTNSIADDAFNSLRFTLFTMSKGSSLAQALNTVYDKRYNDGLQKIYYDKAIKVVSPGKDSVGYMPGIETLEFDIPLGFRQDYTGVPGSSFSGTYLALGAISDSSAIPHPGFINGSLILSFLDN